jgi:hypothetical protein
MAGTEGRRGSAADEVTIWQEPKSLTLAKCPFGRTDGESTPPICISSSKSRSRSHRPKNPVTKFWQLLGVRHLGRSAASRSAKLTGAKLNAATWASPDVDLYQRGERESLRLRPDVSYILSRWLVARPSFRAFWTPSAPFAASKTSQFSASKTSRTMRLMIAWSSTIIRDGTFKKTPPHYLAFGERGEYRRECTREKNGRVTALAPKALYLCDVLADNSAEIRET